MLGIVLALTAVSISDITVDEPVTRKFGDVVYSEAICTVRRQRFCEGKDTRVGVSIAPFYIYDYGEELQLLYKDKDCRVRSFTSYAEINTKAKLRRTLRLGCTDEQRESGGRAVENLSDLYAATRYMLQRAEAIFGPVNKRCKVERSPSGYPLGEKCP